MTKPLFERRATETLDRARSVFTERGTQYGDSWQDCQFLALKATATKLGATIPDDAYRAIKAAALYDAKYQRLQGGYKEDTIDDGINYAAFLAAEIRAVEAARICGRSIPIPRPGGEHAKGDIGGNGVNQDRICDSDCPTCKSIAASS